MALSAQRRTLLSDATRIRWQEGASAHEARWLSANDSPPPRQVVVVDDRTTADAAYGQACQGVALLWRGDFHNARQLLAAMARRADGTRRGPRGTNAPGTAPGSAAYADLFHRHRQARAQRARTLGMLLVQLGADHALELPRAPDVRAACAEAFGGPDGAALVPLQALLGAIGAHQWRVSGIEVPVAGGRIHPHYGVFAPVRGEYVELVAQAPLPAALAAVDLAFDIGTGTGVLAAVLARRGVGSIVATEQDRRALECARENLARLGQVPRVSVQHAHLYPDGRAALVVCNPPWVPARPSSPLEHAVYDPDGRMLRGFLAGLAAHLVPGGEGWLVLSDLAELLGLRTREQLLAQFDSARLEVLGRSDARPTHRRATDAADPLHAARRAEVTSLWRLGARA